MTLLPPTYAHRIQRYFFHYGDTKAYWLPFLNYPPIREDSENTFGNRSVWGDSFVVMGSAGLILGCNIYEPPLDMKTPYGLSYMVKYISAIFFLNRKYILLPILYL